jgi:hypothetical protein
MKLALMGAVVAVAATFATGALAQDVTEQPCHRARSHTHDSRGWQSGDVMMLHHAYEPDRYRYHGGPKSND